MPAPSRSTVVLLLATIACSSSSPDGPGGGETLAIASFAGDGQTALGHADVAIPPAVKVTADGAPKVGVTVNFSVTRGGGVVAGGSAVTGSDGVAHVFNWTLGDPGVDQELRATLNGAQGSPVTFQATAITGPAAKLSAITGDDQTAPAGQAAPIKPIVAVTDEADNPIGGAAVAWSVTAGGGNLLAPETVTAANGQATLGNWVFGQVTGPQELAVTACGACGTVTFHGTATPGPAASLEKVPGGDFQTALVASQVAIPPAVLLKDLYGNVIPGAAVNFAVTQGGGAVTGGSTTTGNDGVATVGGWTLGGTPGENKLTATAGALSVTFTAAGVSGFDPSPYAGNWSGTWVNTTFASTGTGTAVITVDGGAHTATVTATATGNVLGSGGGATPPTQNGSYTNTGAQFNGVVSPMGTISASIQADGTITAVGTNVPNPSITGWTATGTITATTLTLNFTVTFTAGAPAVGTITLTKM